MIMRKDRKNPQKQNSKRNLPYKKDQMQISTIDVYPQKSNGVRFFKNIFCLSTRMLFSKEMYLRSI